MRKYWIKRIICFFLCICLFTGSFAIVPTQKVHSAEYVAGIISAIGGGPILTALLVGGTVVAGGIAIHEIATSTPEDRANFVNGVKDSFQGFVTDFEKGIIMSGNPQIAETEAYHQASLKAVEVVSNFTDNALNVGTTTKNNLSAESVQLWKRYCNNVNNMIDSGVDPNQGTITSGSVVNAPVFNLTEYNVTDKSGDNNANNCIEYNGKWYAIKGKLVINYYQGGFPTMDYTDYGVPSDRWRFYVMSCYPEFWDDTHSSYRFHNIDSYIDVKRLTGEVISTRFRSGDYYYGGYANQLMQFFDGTIQGNTFPTIVGDSYSECQTKFNEIAQNWQSMLPVGGGENTNPEYLKLMASILASTQIGKSIQTGRRQLVNSGTDDIQGIFQLDKTPVKRSSITDTGTGAYTGSVGWDIPASGVWDDVLTGDKPFPYVGGKTGALEVPDSAVTDTDNPNVIEFPDDTVVDNPADNPDNPDTPDKPIKDIIDEQGGTFSPVAMELTNFFPFCIPFDIYYLFNSLVATPETPTFDIEFAYPQKLKPYLGDSFVYTVDFSDFEVVARILKIMLSLLFIFGLMRITRSIIRG